MLPSCTWFKPGLLILLLGWGMLQVSTSEYYTYTPCLRAWIRCYTHALILFAMEISYRNLETEGGEERKVFMHVNVHGFGNFN